MGVGEIQRRWEGVSSTEETGEFQALRPEKEGKWRLCYVITSAGFGAWAETAGCVSPEHQYLASFVLPQQPSTYSQE